MDRKKKEKKQRKGKSTDNFVAFLKKMCKVCASQSNIAIQAFLANSNIPFARI